MKTGWKSFGNVRYYFEQSGTMVTGVRTIDGQKYDFGADGVCKNVRSVGTWKMKIGIIL